MNEGPLVSVLTPSFNQVRWLADNLASVEGQTYRRIEHIVMDGGSRDGSVALLERHERTPLHWRSEPDDGQSHAINKAFRESTGDIIGWLNSDDAYYAPDVVEAAARIFVARPDVAVVYGHAALVNASGLIIQVIWAPPFSAKLLRLHDFICQPAAFIRRSAVDDRLVDESFHYAMDYELWLRLARGSRFARLDRIIAIDRHHPNRKSYTWLDAAERDHAMLRQSLGVVRKSRAVAAARRSVKVALRFAGASLVGGIEPERNPLVWRLDSRRKLLRRQIMTRRAAMPLGTMARDDELASESLGSAVTCPACGVQAMQAPRAASSFRLARCERCGHRSKVTDGKSTLAMAVDIADREPSTPGSWLLERLPPAARDAERLDVLDVGCWDGQLLAGLPAEWRKTGLEPNPAATTRAREAGLDVVTTSFEDWPAEADAFDLVVMFDVLEHLSDPRSAVAKAHEVLRPGGLFAALTGNGACLGARVFGDRWYYCQYPEHISFFSGRSLETVLREHGFEAAAERVGHPMSGHLADGVKLARRLRTGIGREHRAVGSSLGVGANLSTVSRLVRGRDHLWILARKREADAGRHR